MSRYRALRLLGCDVVAAGMIAGLNWAWGVPRGLICFMHVTIEFDHEGPQ